MSPTDEQHSHTGTNAARPHQPHSARYFARLYSPEPQRVALDALFGIEHEVRESLRPGIDHHVAHSRLQWWREECERAIAGQPVHPLSRALVGALPPTALSGLPGIVDVAVWDLARATFETRRELTAYCERWAAAMIEPLAAGIAIAGAVGGSEATAVMLTATAPTAATPTAGATVSPTVGALGDTTDATAPSPNAEGHPWRALGAAIREVELLGELARDARRGRLRVPLDELDHAKVDTGALAKPPWSESLAAIICNRYTVLRGEIARALSQVDQTQQPALRGVVVWAALSYRESQRAERALPDPPLPGRFDAIADAWFAWRVARKATLGRFRLG